MTVQIYVKEVKKDTVEVKMTDQTFSVKFSTMYVINLSYRLYNNIINPVWVGTKKYYNNVEPVFSKRGITVHVHRFDSILILGFITFSNVFPKVT